MFTKRRSIIHRSEAPKQSRKSSILLFVSLQRVVSFMNRNRLRVSCSAAATRYRPRVKFAFQLPFRVHFGQSLKLVGSGVLGDWDLKRSIPMTWSDGDIWKAELEADLDPDETLQYKYIVSNADGGIEAWKPGDNITLSVRQSGQDPGKGGILRILDTWDGSIHEVELDKVSTEASDGEDFILSSMNKSYVELEGKLNLAQNLLERLDDPGSKEMILADRELAVAANKASALRKVVEATNQQRQLDEVQQI
eukprot:g7921.t1